MEYFKSLFYNHILKCYFNKINETSCTAYFQSVKDDVNRGDSNVFVKYVFYFTSEVDNIYIS